jgi:hypothetical protein
MAKGKKAVIILFPATITSIIINIFLNPILTIGLLWIPILSIGIVLVTVGFYFVYLGRDGIGISLILVGMEFLGAGIVTIPIFG